MNVKVGDKVKMTNLAASVTDVIVDVVVLEVHQNGKVVVEAMHGPSPRRRWITNPGFLSPRKSGKR